MIFKFEDVIQNPSKVIEKINSRYSINLNLFTWSKEQEEKVFAMTRNNPLHTANDEPKKQRLKQNITNDPTYSRAAAVYNAAVKNAVPI